MKLKQNYLWFALTSVWVSNLSYANVQEEKISKTNELPTIVITAKAPNSDSNDFANVVNVITQDELSHGASTLGDALNGELGIHSDNFGTGASRPVIRGQNATRLKIFIDSSEVMDASRISPDHAVMVDPIMATKIEVLRGPSVLLYGSGITGGVVNVLDEKIPTELPENDLTAEMHVRGNTVANEKLGAAKLTLGLGEQFALHVEGEKHTADDYQSRGYRHDGEKEERVAGTWNKGQNASVGFSWIRDDDYAGFAYTEQRSQYALPGHQHEYESCILQNMSLSCDVATDDSQDNHEHEAAPWIDLDSKRIDFRAEYQQPFTGVDKVRARASYTDYQHHEIDQQQIATTFKNKAYDGRIEFVHVPLGDWNGMLGTQWSRSDFQVLGSEAFLPKTTTDNLAAFLLEQYQWREDVGVEMSGRIEWQSINAQDNEYKDYDDTALSASVAANWEFIPDYTGILSLSYTERMPNTQELYAKGVHLATNTYELGNQNLDKEQTKSIELAIHRNTDQMDISLNAFYNQIDDYIYADTLDRYEDFRLVQYRQSDANFYGAEGELSYQFTPMYQAKVFADYVRAQFDQGGNLPRIPEARTGVEFHVDFLDGIQGSMQYIYGFKQDRIANFEDFTDAYHLVNVDLSYVPIWDRQWSYEVYLKAQNLLDETYFNHTSYLLSIPQQGRNFTMGLQFKF